jgi:arylformamidase
MDALKIIDLSHTLSSSISVYPGSDNPVIHPVAFIEEDGYRENRLILSSHHGTHVDCPVHLLREGFNTGDAPLSVFFGKGLVIDCRKYAPDDRISPDPFFSLEAEIGRVDFLLFCTGMDKHWNTPLYDGKFPVLAPETAEYLTRFSLKGIGIDTLSVDPVKDTALINHKTFLSSHMVIIENLTGIEQLTDKKFWFSCFPLKIEGGDGSPVRACAIIEGFESLID